MSKGKKCVSQKTIRQEWVPLLLRLFQESMPAIDAKYPKVYIATDVTLPKIKQEIEDRGGVKFRFKENFYENGLVEYVHDAIVVYMENVPTDCTEEDFYIEFIKGFFNALARFYVTHFEPEEWRRVFLLDDADWFDYCIKFDMSAAELAIQTCLRLGYRLWHVFSTVAITISTFLKAIVIDSDSSEDPYDSSASSISSAPSTSSNVSDDPDDLWLKDLLESIFDKERIDEFELGSYFAHLFAHNLENDFEDSVTALPDYVRVPMREIKKLLENQFHKDSFWVVNEDWLHEIGEVILQLKSEAILAYGRVAEALGGDDNDEDYKDNDYDGSDYDYAPDYDDKYTDNLTTQPAPDKKKKKAKRKAQKQARKNNRRKK